MIAVVEAVEPGLALRHDRRLEGSVAVARDVKPDRPVLGKHRLGVAAVAAVAAAAPPRVALLEAEMMAQLGPQRALQKRLLQLLEKSVLAQKAIRLLLTGKQGIKVFGLDRRHVDLLL
jgi:hypothetical protein